MIVTRQYPNHHYQDEWTKDEFFCPKCGKQELWREGGSGDYYLGPSYYCVACETEHYLHHARDLKEPYEKKIIEQLRSGVTLEPTTPRGN